MDESEVVDFDGNGVVIDGGVSPAVMDEARSRQEQIQREHPQDEAPTLRECIVSILRENGDIDG